MNLVNLYKSGKIDATTAMQMLADAASQKAVVNPSKTPTTKDDAVDDDKGDAENPKKRLRDEEVDDELDQALNGEECNAMDSILNYAGNDFLFAGC